MIAAAAAAIGLGGGAQPAAAIPLPAEDAFYTPPPNLASLPNGAIIRQRDAVFGLSPSGVAKLAADAFGLAAGQLLSSATQAIANGFVTYQVLYKSTDGAGAPVAEAATILIPNLPWAGSGTRPVISYQTAEDSVSTNCQPSYVLQAGLLAQGGGALSGSLEALLALPALLKGYAIVYPDYEGPQSQWLAGPQAGHATLDGLRAALHSGHGLSPSTQVALWGYSGGGGATAWTATLAGSYAPELNVVGAAIGATSNSDLAAVFKSVDGSLIVGFLPTGIVGTTRATPIDLGQVLTNDGIALVQKAADPNKCLGQEILTFATAGRMEKYSVDPNRDFTQIPVVRQLLTANSIVGQSVAPAFPVLNYHEAFDKVVPVSADNAMAQQWCRAGTSVEIIRYSTPIVVDPTRLAGHVLGAAEGYLAALQYISNRFAGLPQRNDCPNANLWAGLPLLPYLPGLAR